MLCFFDRGHPCFRNINSTIPNDVIRVKWNLLLGNKGEKVKFSSDEGNIFPLLTYIRCSPILETCSLKTASHVTFVLIE